MKREYVGPSSDPDKPGVLSLKALMKDLASGGFYGVFIDDTGSPGSQATTTGPHPERFSWVGVVIAPSQMPEVLREMPRAIGVLRDVVGASEFHCRDIFQGEREFKNVPLGLRLGLLEFLAYVFDSFRFPIFVQTLDPVNLADIHRREPRFNDAKEWPFDFSEPRDAALFFLLVQIRNYLAAQRQSPSDLARLFADEGFIKGGRALELRLWRDVFADGLLCFADSARVFPLQLADFAAYALNRHQILRGKQKLSELDRTLLALLTKAHFNFQNIPSIRTKIRRDGTWDFGPPQ